MVSDTVIVPCLTSAMIPVMMIIDYPTGTMRPQYECDVKGALNAGLYPVWYIGAIDLPHREDRSILTVTDWDALKPLIAAGP